MSSFQHLISISLHYQAPISILDQTWPTKGPNKHISQPPEAATWTRFNIHLCVGSCFYLLITMTLICIQMITLNWTVPYVICLWPADKGCLCAQYPPLSVSPSLSLPPLSSLYYPLLAVATELYANTKSYNALYCLVLTFEYLNGAF